MRIHECCHVEGENGEHSEYCETGTPRFAMPTIASNRECFIEQLAHDGIDDYASCGPVLNGVDDEAFAKRIGETILAAIKASPAFTWRHYIGEDNKGRVEIDAQGEATYYGPNDEGN